MQELNAIINNLNAGALTNAIQAAIPGKCFGISTYGPVRPISIWLDDSAVQADKDSATALVTAHDPVFLTVDKTTIKADNVDAATVTVSAPKANAAPVTLLIGGNPIAVTLINGTGSFQISSAVPTLITISLQNPQNRATDVLIITAI